MSPSPGSPSLLDTVINNNIGRVVAFIVTPILLPLVGAGSFWLQDAIGIDLQQYTGAAIAFVVAVIVGVALAIFKWLEGLGLWQKAIAELHTLYEAGRQAADQQQVPPPGA